MDGLICGDGAAYRGNTFAIRRPGKSPDIREQAGVPCVSDNVLSGGRIPLVDSCANPARGQAQSFRRPGNGVDCGSHVDTFDYPRMTSVGKEGLSSIGVPDPYQPIASCRSDAISIRFPGDCNHITGMDVIGAKYRPFSSSLWGCLGRRLRGWRCTGVVFCQPSLLEHMEDKTRSILCS